MELKPNTPINLPSPDALEVLDLGKCLDYLRYLQSLDPEQTESGRIKIYIQKIKKRILSLVIG